MPHAADVDRGDRADHRDTREPARDGPERHELTQVVREGHRQGRGRAGVDREKQCPAEEKRRHRTERLAHVDVAPACVREHGAELTEGERAEQRQHAARDPDKQGHAEVAPRLSQHGARDQEDARADGGADDDEGEIAQSQDAPQLARHRGRPTVAWPPRRRPRGSSPYPRGPACAPPPRVSPAPTARAPAPRRHARAART